MTTLPGQSVLRLIITLLISALLISCGGNPAQEGNSAGIAFHLKWPLAKSVGSVAPGVVTVRVSISAPDMATIITDFSASAGTGSIADVPVGSGRTITFQGLDANLTLIYQAVLPDKTLVPGVLKTFTAAMVPVLTAPVPTAPTAPSGLSATAISSSQINLAWVDTANDETGYKIERKTGSGGAYALIATAAPNDTVYNDTPLSADATYYYRVLATNGVGDSAPGEANASTTVAAPASTYSISGTITSGGIPLAGATVTRSGSGTTTTSTDNGGNYIINGALNGSYTLTPAKTGYTFTPASLSVTVGGADLTAMNFLPAAVDTVPASPSGLVASVITSSQINLAWSDNANNETGYRIERKTGLSGTFATINDKISANVTIYSDTSLSAATPYYYRVLAFNEVGNSGYIENNFTTSPNTYGISGSITRGGTAFTGVSVSLSGNDATATTTNSGGVYSFSGALDGGYTLTPSKVGYAFTPASQPVTVNGANLTAATFAATADAAPADPSGLSATVETASQIKLAWVDNSINETGYTIERKIGSGGTYDQIGTAAADATAYNDNNISSSTTYYYRVWASNETGASGYSAEAVYTTAAVPTAPTGDIFPDPYTGLQLVKVTGGTYTMGDTFGGPAANERPAHSVTLNNFYIGKFEVTQGEWFAVMGTNPSGISCASCPVETVSWNDVQAFIVKLNGLSNKSYRLPTEAEWEYAAAVNVNVDKEKYSGGSVVGDVAWYSANATVTNPVGLKLANSRGIYDMSGNVWEWVNDWYASYTSTALNNPTGPASSQFNGRIVRGGSWKSISSGELTTTSRGFYTAVQKYNYLGFRIAASP